MGEMRPDRFGSRPRRVGHRLRVILPAALAEEAAAIVAEVAGDVEARDVVAGPGGTPRRLVEGRLDPGATGDEDAEALAARLEAFEGAHPGAALELEREEHFVEEDRGATRREEFVPLLAAPGLVLRPPWRPHRARPGEHVLEIDPGPAFGSGSHASTRLALALLRERCDLAPPRRMLDLGTGTGVLAMAGALWGAAEVLGVDCDPDAVAAARENVARNGLAGRVGIAGRGVEELHGPFDLIVANVTLEVLLALARHLSALLAPGGAIVLSGLLAGGQEEEARAAYRRLGLGRGAHRREGEWVALLLEAVEEPGAHRRGEP